jgi:hypothetical protein
MKALLALGLLGPSFLLAQSRFDGTWRMNMETIQLSGPAEEYLLKDGVYHCFTCAPRVDVKADGTDQKVSGHPYFDTLSVRIVDVSSIEFHHKKDGKPTFTATETVSADNNTMVEEFSEDPASQRVTGHATFTRVSSGPPGSHVLSGSWEMRTIRNVGSGPTTTYQSTKDGLKESAGNTSFDAKFDGKDYPVVGDPGHGTVSLNQIDENTIEETDKQGGKVVRVTRMTVSKDGKSMQVKSVSRLRERESTMTYTAEKQP